MSANEDSEVEQGTRRSASASCKPLLDAATPELFQTNAFRITGLPVDATAREIKKHADKLKMMEELGQGEAAHTAAFALNPPPSVDQIRNAIQKLTDPEQRVVDEFFWFWPERFGQGASDPSIRALANGDSNRALEIWVGKETDPTDGVVAMHNIALFWHLAALEWENYSKGTELSDEQRREVEQYWRNAFKRWEHLAVDDLFWERVSARIKQLDDPRLTTGFVRRMRATLPQALDKINAQLAVRYLENGRMELARLHVQFMRETNQGLDNMEKTAELVLAPASIRLKEHIQRARQHADENPLGAPNAARELLEHAHRSLVAFDLFHGEGEHRQKDVFSDVAEAAMICAIAHQRKTSDSEIFVTLLEQALPFAMSTDVQQRIQKNLGIGKENLKFKLLEPIYEALSAIEKSAANPKTKLARIRQEIIPHLAGLIRTEGSGSSLASSLSDGIASALRSISIDAHNDKDDLETSLDAISFACEMARGPELVKRLTEDKAQITRNKSERIQHNLARRIKNDEVAVTREIVRYNSTTLPGADINGVRFGIFTQYYNGTKAPSSYLIAVSSATHGSIDIECRRFLRPEDEAAADFHAIVQALYYQIIPQLVARLSKSIAYGVEVPFGDCWLTAKGIRVPTGVLFWKEEHLISWTDVRFGTHQGVLTISSSQNSKVSKAFSLRDVSNAVIFKELADATVTLLNKR